MATENALMAAALTPGHDRRSATPPASRTCRTSRACSSRWAPTIEGIGSNVHDRPRRRASSAAASTRSRPTTSRSARSWRSPASPAASCASRTCVAGRPADDPARLRARSGLRSRARRRRRHRPRRPEARRRSATSASYKSKVQDGPWPAFPADLTSIAVALATQCRGLGADPRVDVREPPVLHRQADLDGRRRSRSATRTARSSSARAGCAASALESPDIRAGMAMLIAALCAEGTQRDRQHPPDRPRLRAHRRAPARARRAHRARRHRARR